MKQWGGYGGSCLWFSIQVFWTKQLSYSILQKGFYGSYRPPKALSAVSDCLLCPAPIHEKRLCTPCSPRPSLCWDSSAVLMAAQRWTCCPQNAEREREDVVSLYETFQCMFLISVFTSKPLKGTLTPASAALSIKSNVGCRQAIGPFHSLIYFLVSDNFMCRRSWEVLL